MKPDRFTKMVDEYASHNGFFREDGATLLRRQFAQVRRVVVKLQREIDPASLYAPGRRRAYDDVLAALDAYKRGTK